MKCLEPSTCCRSGIQCRAGSLSTGKAFCFGCHMWCKLQGTINKPVRMPEEHTMETSRGRSSLVGGLVCFAFYLGLDDPGSRAA